MEITKTNYSSDEFAAWFAAGLKEYLDSHFSKEYNNHIEDLMYATASYTEAVMAFIAARPRG